MIVLSMRTRAGIFALALLATACLAGCGGPATGPEEALRAWIAGGIEAAEARERRALLGMVAPSYADARGNGRDDIGNLLRVYFLRQERIALLTKIDAITVYGDSAASIEMTVGMAGTNSGTFGFNAEAYRFVLEVEREGDDWQLISARWGELGRELR